MGQKVNPIGYRVGFNKYWESIWFSEKNYVSFFIEDQKIRKFISKNYKRAYISRIEIARFPNIVDITIHSAKPGIIIGRKGAEIEDLTKKLSKIVANKRVEVRVKEIKTPELDSSFVGQDIANQIEKRISYKRAIKQAIKNTMKAGAKGIKIRISGRLNGAEIARSEEFKEGQIPLSTLNADIDYRISESMTEMGVIGIKVWILR